jgi:hypothetical protein
MDPSGAESRLAYARFPAGFGPVIGRCLERASIRGVRLMDEACVFPARAKSERRVAGLFTALYQVVDRLEPSARTASADYCAAEFARKLGSLTPGLLGRNGHPRDRAQGDRDRASARASSSGTNQWPFPEKLCPDSRTAFPP